jgi:hypothetical protein
VTGWGEVLEAMHLAPRGVRTVRLVVDQRHGGVVIPTGPPPPEPGGLGIGTSIVTGRSITRATVTFTASGAAGDPIAPWRTQLWYEAGTGRYRLRRAGSTTVVDGTHRWSDAGEGRVLKAPLDAQPEHEILLLLTNPEALLGWFRFDDHDATTALGRPAHWIRGTRRNTPIAGVLDVFLPGDTVDAVADAETGVLLELQLRAGPAPTFSMHVTECAFDDFDPDEVLTFEVPPGARVLTPEMFHEELRAEHLARRGPGFGDGLLGTGRRPALAEVSMAIGPPPDDIEGATAAIRFAVEHLTDIDDDDRCPHIQGGENLADCVRQTRRSAFVDEDHPATYECGEIAFVRADEADVRFRVVVPKAPVGGIDTQGRALMIGGRWVIDRATVCGLFSMAGVTCPPPPRH